MSKKEKRPVPDFVIWLCLIIGSLCLLYPIVSNYILSSSSKQAIVDYDKIAAEVKEENKQNQLNQAREYNASLYSQALVDPFGQSSTGESGSDWYENILNITSEQGINGVMGYIEIPKISVNLPIFHGTSDEVLSAGAGHLVGSSLPVGGDGTHAVLTSHSGLPSNKLFTDLEKLKVGDQFYITVLGDKMAYEIDSFQTIEPTNTSWFSIEPDKDQVTLLTCTPIGINSHRLLVTGHRIDYSEVEEVTSLPDWTAIWSIVGIVCATLAVIYYTYRRKKRKKLK